MSMRTLQRSFGGGEITPEMWSRIDDARFQTGLALCRNFRLKPQGPAENRPGFLFVREVKNSAAVTRAIPFTYSTTQTMVIEVGAGYFRFHTTAATLLYSTPAAWATTTPYAVGDLRSNGGVNYYCTAVHTSGTFATDLAAGKWYAMPSNPNIYEIPNPYAAADLMDIHFVQSADVLTLTHTGYAPRELRRVGATNWQLSTPAFQSSQVPPTGVGAVATGGTGTTYDYRVTSVGALNTDESLVSSSATCNGNLFTTAAFNTISWSAAAGASRYFVYKKSGGLWGYIGQTDQLSFVDNNIAADMSRTPPISQPLFNAANDYPGAVSYFEQRRVFAGTLNKPQNLWMTKSGTESNMNYCLPLRDDDSIQFRVAAREANTIRHIVPLGRLVLLTSGAEWAVTSINSDAVTPNTVSVDPQSYVGASMVQPVIIANNLVYCAARGGHVREMAYAYQANGYVSGDLCLRAPHLFDFFDIKDMAYQKAPYPIIWCVSSSGKLLGLTYIPEQQVGAWHQHDTDGTFESCCIVAEGAEDVLYCVVKRTINGAQKRYIECLHTRQFATQADAFFVDCGLTYSGAPTSTITGLNHLEGKTVSILGDGAVMPQRTVSGGSITLDQPVSKAQVGLPITADLQTLPLAIEIQGYGQGRPKNINNAWLRVFQSGGIFVGPRFDALTEVKQRTTEPYGTPPSLKTDEIQISITPSWGPNGQICIRQTAPLPLTLTGLSLDITIGG
jgi:hypothetical protein